MYESYMKIGWMVWIIILMVWVMYISASVQSHRDRLAKLEKDIKKRTYNYE
jgi:uncharacterized membrane protein YukC